MSVDRTRIARLISTAKAVEVATLNPSDGDQVRKEAIRKATDRAVRSSDRRSVLVVTIET